MKAVLLYSGGADSRLILDLAQSLAERVVVLLVNYGQRHVEELDYARRQLADLGISPLEVSVDLNGTVQSTLLNHQSENDPTTTYPGAPRAYVPSRNMMFIAIAAAHAESIGFDEIWIGCDFTDRVNRFPDCSQEWIVKMNELLMINGAAPIKLVAPLLGLDKDQVLSILKSKGVDRRSLFSGYEAPTT